MPPAMTKLRNGCSSLPSPDESEWVETGEADMVDLSELQEALVDMAVQDSRPSDHNTRIDDDYADSEGPDDNQVTILSNVDIELVVGALDLTNLSQLDGALQPHPVVRG